MLLAYTMLKLLWKIESSLIYGTLRLFRGTLGHGADKTLDNIEILHDSANFLIVNKSCDVILNHHDPNRRGKHFNDRRENKSWRKVVIFLNSKNGKILLCLIFLM